MKILAGTLLEGGLFRTLRRRAVFGPFADLNAARREIAALPEIPPCDLNDFGRGGEAVRRMTLAAWLTAWDAGGLSPEIGVIGWNGAGCTAENRRYWRDYTDCGREAGRGSLFVATLPTIPYCEAAIALGCRGPVAYFRTVADTAALAAQLAACPSGRYLCGEITADTLCVLLAETADAPMPRASDLEALFNALEAER